MWHCGSPSINFPSLPMTCLATFSSPGFISISSSHSLTSQPNGSCSENRFGSGGWSPYGFQPTRGGGMNSEYASMGKFPSPRYQGLAGMSLCQPCGMMEPPAEVNASAQNWRQYAGSEGMGQGA